MSTYVKNTLPRGEAIRLLTQQDVGIRGFAAQWPAPRWIKIWEDGEPSAKMVWLNGAYARWYDIDPREYIGRPDSSVWDEATVMAFREGDLEAIKRAGQIISKVEPTPRGAAGDVAVVRKFAFRVADSGICGWGIYGEICPLDRPMCVSCDVALGRNSG